MRVAEKRPAGRARVLGWTRPAALQTFDTDILLPNINCDHCVFQVVQFMAEHGVNNPGVYTYHHCAFYLMSGSTVAAHAADLEGYDTSKGTIRFQANEPLPAALVRKLVKARIAEG